MTDEYDAGYEHYIDELHREIIDYQIEVEQVKDENAKLRELVRDMWRGCPVDERDCIACDFERDGMCDLFDRMRELGVDA